MRLLSILLALSMFAVSAAADERSEPRVILISIDGLMPSSYTSATSPAVNLRKLAAEGVYAAGVVGVLPTVTFPSHTTLITGVDPAAHGIVDNRILDPANVSNGAWYWYARAIKVPTLPMAARARGLRAAAVAWPVTVGMDLDYVVPEYFRSDHPESLAMLRALSQPRDLLDVVARHRGTPFSWPQSDRDRTDITKFIVRTFDPHVLLLHLMDLDDAQHAHGPGAPEANATLARLDGYVGEIVEAARASGRPTHIVIASDHGFLPVRTMVQPNAEFLRNGLLRLDARGGVAEWRAYFHASGGMGFVFVKDAADRERVHAMLLALKQNPANGIRQIWTRAELDAQGANPDAAFALDVVDGFSTGSGADALVKPSDVKGTHGFAPDRPALHASFILAGPTVQKPGNLGVIRMTQIAPTLAQILGVGLSPQAGKPLTLSAAPSTTAGQR